jgi:hypothetical protein
VNIPVPPPHAIRSASGFTWLDDDGILVAVSTPQNLHTLENAEENHRINVLLAAGKRRPFLIDMSHVKTMSRDARAFYAGTEPKDAITAVALLTQSAVSKVVANFFLRLTPPALPTRMFTDFAEAKNWLMQFRETP